MRYTRSLVSIFLATLVALGLAVRAAQAADDSGSAGSETGPAPYAKFITGAQVQNGLLNVIRKNGKVYLEIASSQLDRDFIQSAETVNGLGGYFVIPGGITSWTRIVRFTRNENKIVVTWPNTYFVAPGNDAAQRAVNVTIASSTVTVAPIVATDATTGHVVFDASFFLTDIYNLAAVLKQVTGADKPDQAYSLDSDRTLFGPTKAFPLNVIIDADQTWKSDNPQTVDNVPDPRSIAFRIAYNITATPVDGDYMPRLADDRVGYFDSPYLNFASDSNYTRLVRYVVRWNVQPSDPSRRISAAKHPMVFYLSNNIPVAYRPAVRRGILDWNAAFEKIGISDAVAVKDQPSDPAWDPDDIRYNTVIWLTQSNTTGYAAENQVIDPRTGQEIRNNIVIDSDVMSFSNTSWQFLTEPTAGDRFRGLRDDRSYGRLRRVQAEFGKIALDLMGRQLRGEALTQYNDQLLESFVVHESGHSMGLQHNFISSMAYTPKQLQSKDFTSRRGVATSVMEYSPLNLWPKGFPQGTYWQTVLGSYDYHAIHWGYAAIPGARTPADEVPTLNRWASAWTNPLYRFANDEDVEYHSAHAIDPRVAQWDLSSDPLGWAGAQLKLSHDLMAGLDHRWPKFGHTYDQERAAFNVVLFTWMIAALQPSHFVGGEYLSRAHQGDPGAPAPLTQVSRADERRAFDLLDKYVLSENAWRFSPATLNRLVYSEWEPTVTATWAYDPQPRHDIPIAEIAEGFARNQLEQMFQPLMFERLNDLSLKAKPGVTMSLTDLFDWTQSALYGDLHQSNLSSIGEVHRALQQWYARKLAQIWLAPTPGTPFDAQSLARAKLVALRHDLASALGRGGLDELTRAHLDGLADVVSRALDARVVVPVR
ncbi:MAG TPA: zinc-dependent metalloprotease [Candidatus Acidoferrales bacterium]|nr:zinc-dependent metalloprotease [Candidatus Acidoferrales bacterium]